VRPCINVLSSQESDTDRSVKFGAIEQDDIIGSLMLLSWLCMRLDSKFVTCDVGVKLGLKTLVAPSVQQSLPQLEHRHCWRLFAVLDLYLLSIVTFNLLVIGQPRPIAMRLS
jgi:hypothetical protein